MKKMASITVETPCPTERKKSFVGFFFDTVLYSIFIAFLSPAKFHKNSMFATFPDPIGKFIFTCFAAIILGKATLIF